MLHDFPEVTHLLPDEEWSIARIRVARYLSQLPSTVDEMSIEDVSMVLEIMRADAALGNMMGV